MYISNNNNHPNFTGGLSLAKFITSMTKADNLAPIVALEATVTGGRTIQAYKRGGREEGRERIIEETTGAIVWLWGVKVLNSLGDNLLGRYLKTPGKVFDVGTDKVLRTPFNNYMKNGTKKNISQTKVAALKGAKVLASIIIANLFVGFVVPAINHYITNTVRHDKKEKALKEQELLNQTQSSNNSDDNKEISFKGAVGALNVFTNAIENTNTGKLLSTDFGVAGGRMINARTKEERNEIAFRDLGSIYFYMWASGHVGNLLNLIENGRATRLNPQTTNILDEYLTKMLAKHGNELSVEEFRKLALGMDDAAIKLPKEIVYEEGKLSFTDKVKNLFGKNKTEPLKVAKVSDLEKIITDKNVMDRIKQMSKLQPLREGEAVITKQQIIDAFNVAEINNPDLLGSAFSEYTGGKGKVIGKNEQGKNILSKTEFEGGAYIDEFKYVSNKKLYRLKSQMRDYITDICKSAKDGKVTDKLISNMKKKNTTYNGINFIAGFAVAAAFLSTIIPKLQYLMTQKKTGLNVFPGTYDYEHHREFDA